MLGACFVCVRKFVRPQWFPELKNGKKSHHCNYDIDVCDGGDDDNDGKEEGYDTGDAALLVSKMMTVTATVMCIAMARILLTVMKVITLMMLMLLVLLSVASRESLVDTASP